MPFRLLRKKDKAKSPKERLIHGKYTKREDTTKILQVIIQKQRTGGILYTKKASIAWFAEVPDGWERVESQQYGICYVNQQANAAQHEHPGQVEYIQHYKHINHQPAEDKQDDNEEQNDVEVELSHNSFSDEIPTWLMIYAQASPEYDGFLKWELFRYSELDCWQTIMKRLYKKEVEQIVMRYEEYHQALQREIERRQKQQKRLSSQALADLDRESDV
ncbi:hypothetical protein QZH41_008329 [Actinostola sp. cb2023]|nr:hypothetical protein QZH41_008329 [Actinostola sp. cb2023]